MKSLKNLAKMISEASREKPIHEEFLWMLEQTIVREAEKEAKKPSQTFKPSSLGSCLRMVYYQVTGAEVEHVPETASGVGIAESGTDRHIRIQTAVTKMKQNGFPCEWIDVEEYLKKHPQKGTRVVEKKGMETKLRNDDLNLSFMCDGIILLHGVYYVLEIKTEASFKFQKREDAEEEHKVQASCYSLALGIDRVMYLYENRDLCNKLTFFYRVPKEDKEEKVINRIKLVNEHIEARTLPPKTENKKKCKYCDYPEKCRREEITYEYYEVKHDQV